MTRVRTPKTQQTRTASKAVRVGLSHLLLLAAALLCLVFASTASADLSICTPGTVAGKCEAPQGLATDFETGRLYVADRGNNRIDVFAEDGSFVMAFGWGVDTGAKELQTCTTASSCQAGIAGSGAGQFDHPTWVAVDNYATSAAHHDVYVGTDNFRVQRFSPAGGLIKAFGKQGTGECEFANGKGGSHPDPIGVGPEGNVYVADNFEAAFNSFTNRIERFDSEGNCLGEVELFKASSPWVVNFAVDSAGNSYVEVEGDGLGGLRKYDPSGALLYTLDAGTESQGIAIDEADNVFAKQHGKRSGKPLTESVLESIDFITEYGPGGQILRRFHYALIGGSGNFIVPGLAAYSGASGDLFASLGLSYGTKEVDYLAFDPPGPVVVPEGCTVKPGTLGNTKATLLAEVNPEGKATTAHFDYVSQKHFEDEGFANPEETEESESVGADFELHEATAKAVLVPETEYRCRVVATNADGSAKGQEGSFTSKEPLEFGPTTVSEVQPEAAILNAVVNPLGIETKGFFEYVEEATYLKDIEDLGPGHGFAHASTAPAATELEFGSGEKFTTRSTVLSGLKPGTAYRFRAIATNPFPPFTFTGETEYFRTYAAGAEGLPDQRGFELVSPGQKNSAEVAVPGIASGVIEDRTILVQASDSAGEAVTYTSFTSFGEADGAPASSQYLSRRTAGGWQTQNISPHGFVSFITVPPYSGFTPELGFGAFKMSLPSLAPGCPEGFEGLYLRDSSTGTVHCLSDEVPQSESNTGCNFVYAGSSEDGTRAFFASGRSYAGAPVSAGFSLYEWSEAEGLRVMSVLPGESEPATPTLRTSFGSNKGLGSATSEACQVGLTTMRHVISSDGRTAFWTYVPESGASMLLARLNGEETVQLDAKVGGGKGGGDGNFLAASADGSLAFFSAPGKLNSEAKGAGHLYRYNTQERTLEDLTPGSVDAEVQGVLGASEDGSAIYFVANGALSGEQKGPSGEIAEMGKPNLYLYRDGEGLSFIARLAGEDGPDWDSSTKNLRARVTPDGRHLAFVSIESKALAGYDNTMATGQHCEYEYNVRKLGGGNLCPQAFLYDADAKTLTCASCNPTGARPLGPGLVPGWANVYQGPRYLSDDGSRFFFESFDAISPGDENGKRDIYEFELPGSGTCTDQSPAFDPRSGGCHYLISGGKSTDETYLVDASADGRDVFFSTRSELAGWDPNTNYDVYDAREGGGFPEPSVRPDCVGEACKPPASDPPAFTAPPRFEGPSNPHPKTTGRKHGKKKHKKKHHKQNKHGKARHMGRTSR